MRDLLRRLWQDHVALTRMFVLARVRGTPDLGPTLARLMRNQDDIGAALGSALGPAVGQAAARLLRRHIELAGQVLEDYLARRDLVHVPALRANASAIASALSAANPRWGRAALDGMLQQHLNQLLSETTAAASGDSRASLEWYDRSVDHILSLADELARGMGEGERPPTADLRPPTSQSRGNVFPFVRPYPPYRY